MQSRLALSKDSAVGFDPLEFDRFTRVQELTRMMAESVNDVATVQRNLQRDMAGAEDDLVAQGRQARSEEHTSELQSPCNLVCRLLLEKKKSIDGVGRLSQTSSSSTLPVRFVSLFATIFPYPLDNV